MRESYAISMIQAARQEFEQNFNAMAKQFGELQNMQALLDLRGEALEESIAKVVAALTAGSHDEGKRMAELFKTDLEDCYKKKAEEFKVQVEAAVKEKAKVATEKMKEQNLIVPVTPAIVPATDKLKEES